MELDGRTVSGGYSYGLNSMPKDDDVKGKGNSYDFGARMYDSRLGKWLSIDPLKYNYPSISPFAFCINTPIIVTDPDGARVRVMSKEALNVLLSSLTPEDRAKIKVNWRGYIKSSSVKEALKNSNSENLQALYILVKDKRTIEFYSEETSYEYFTKVKNENTGEINYVEQIDHFNAPSRKNPYQELMKEFNGAEEEKKLYGQRLIQKGFADETIINGSFGSTLRPISMQNEFQGGKIAKGKNIEVYVNPVGTSAEEKAANVGHELFGHAYFFIIGKDPRHGGSSKNLQTGNPGLEHQINQREAESMKNCNCN